MGGWRVGRFTGFVYRDKIDPHLFVKVPRPGDSEVTFTVFESQSR